MKNAGKDCWGGCKGKQGACAWCGAGLCCRYGWKDKSNGCSGTHGIKGKGHVCTKDLTGGTKSCARLPVVLMLLRGVHTIPLVVAWLWQGGLDSR